MLLTSVKTGVQGLAYQNARSFGANIKALSLRIKAVSNIRKITKAMKMVSAAKMKKDIERLHRGQHFGNSVVPKIMENDTYLQRKKSDAPVKKTLLVPITGDKGLCGSVNSQIVRHVKTIMEGKNRAEFNMLPIGDKGSLGLARPFPDMMKNSITGIATPYNYITAAAISNYVMNYDVECDRITLIYSWFKNSMTNIVSETHLLGQEAFRQQWKSMVRYEAEEPEKTYNLPYYYELYISSQVYYSLIHAAASEQSSRMNAMEGASKNAGDVIQNLTMAFNRARQTKITMELIEIISGANAV